MEEVGPKNSDLAGFDMSLVLLSDTEGNRNLLKGDLPLKFWGRMLKNNVVPLTAPDSALSLMGSLVFPLSVGLVYLEIVDLTLFLSYQSLLGLIH